jgi:hypothetical protein
MLSSKMAFTHKRVFVYREPRCLPLNRSTRVCVPQVSSEHHLRRPPRELSRNSQPQLGPWHSRTGRRSPRPVRSSLAAIATL